jgi:malate/lactate dehydrogenase
MPFSLLPTHLKSQLRVQLSPALSAAAAICAHVHDWLLGTRPGEFVSMGVITDRNNSYGIVPGLVYSFPVECSNGSWTIVKGNPPMSLSVVAISMQSH